MHRLRRFFQTSGCLVHFVRLARLVTAHQSSMIHSCASVGAFDGSAPRIGVTASPGSLSYKPYVACQDGRPFSRYDNGGRGRGQQGWQTSVMIVGGIHCKICTLNTVSSA